MWLNDGVCAGQCTVARALCSTAGDSDGTGNSHGGDGKATQFVSRILLWKDVFTPIKGLVFVFTPINGLVLGIYPY